MSFETVFGFASIEEDMADVWVGFEKQLKIIWLF